MTTVAPPPPEVVLGLDVGTTGTKVVAFGLGRAWRHVAIREYPLLEPAPRQQTQDPAEVIDAMFAAIAESAAACQGAHVVSLSVSAAMHGLVGLDTQLRPLTPMVTWADGRAHEEARRLRGSSVGADLHRRTGTPIHPMSPLTKLQWFARYEPDLAAEARWWVGLKDHVLWSLTATLATELSSASGTGLFDLRARTWDRPALELAGITEDQLPTVLSPTATLNLSGSAAQRTGLPAGLPVVVGAADGPLGNLGTRAVEPGIVSLSLGTSGAARAVVTAPPPDLDTSLFCYALTDELWVVGGAISNGGIVIRWAGDALAPDVTGGPDRPRDADLLDLAATAPAGCDGLVMLPYLLAERAPLWDPELAGAYLGLRRSHTRAHLIRAAVEGVSLQLSTIVDQLDRLEPVTAVRVTGGAFRSPLWRDVLAATLGRPITVVGQAEGSALGAAAIGLVALGQATSLEDALDLLAPPETAADIVVPPDPDLIGTYDRTRQAIPGLLGDLAAVGRLFAGAPDHQPPSHRGARADTTSRRMS